jgi:ATP-dependent RNA helicase RhlE
MSMQFADLRLAEPILRSVVSEGYVTATPVQAQSIPPALEGRDVLACAQTGTGKTAAFALPILHRLSSAPAQAHRRARCLVLCPTRELAVQIRDGFRTYGKFLSLRQALVFGGVNQNPQVQDLRRGVDIIVATPGRLLDLMNQGHVDLRGIETFVLDEADRMLDMGFINDIRKIAAQVPAKRQTLLFSATMPPEIRKLAESLLRNPATIQIAPVAATTDLIEQSVYMVEKKNKPALLAHLVKEVPMYRTIVFTRTKHGADRVVRGLHARGIKAEAIHGNKTQNNRQRALDNFRANKTPVLVATDIASRGIDVDDITHVVNYDVTHEPETYVHRIGRTGRAGAKGHAVSFCDREELSNLKAIERLIRRTIPVKTDHPVYESVTAESTPRHGGGSHQSSHPRRPHEPRPSHAPAKPPGKPAAAHQVGRGAAPAGRPHAPRPQHPVHGKPAGRPNHRGGRQHAGRR